MPTHFQTHEEALSAGYVRVQGQLTNDGLSFFTRYEKPIGGAPPEKGYGHSHVSQEDADARALAALNSWRDKRYGLAPEGGNRGVHVPGGVLRVDED
jgi:hypothetical protein